MDLNSEKARDFFAWQRARGDAAGVSLEIRARHNLALIIDRGDTREGHHWRFEPDELRFLLAHLRMIGEITG